MFFRRSWSSKCGGAPAEISPDVGDAELVFTGDVYLEDPAWIDVPGTVVFNHEYVVSTPNDIPETGRVNLLARKQHAVGAFPQAAALHACLNNNHSLDFGSDVLARTVQELEEAGVHCHLDPEDGAPAVHSQRDRRWALLAYNATGESGIAALGRLTKRMNRDAAAVRERGADRIVVALHFGEEHAPVHSEAQQVAARAAVDAGADLVIGHHPHCIQDVEVYRGKHIFYSLGNTWFQNHVTPSFFDDKGRPQRIFRARQTRWNSRALLVGFDLKDCGVRIWETSCSGGRFRVLKETSAAEVNRSVSSPNSAVTWRWRRWWLLVKSNVFVDGHLIDFSVFSRSILEKLGFRRKLRD